jgi:hypothetical protein
MEEEKREHGHLVYMFRTICQVGFCLQLILTVYCDKIENVPVGSPNFSDQVTKCLSLVTTRLGYLDVTSSFVLVLT